MNRNRIGSKKEDKDYAYQQAKEIFNKVLNPTLIVNEYFEIIRINQKFLEKYNYSLKDLMDHHITQIISKYSWKKVKNELTILINRKKDQSKLSKIKIKNKKNNLTNTTLKLNLLNDTGEILIRESNNLFNY